MRAIANWVFFIGFIVLLTVGAIAVIAIPIFKLFFNF